MRIGGGQLARYLTTYDAAVYSIIFKLAGGGEAPPYLSCQKIAKGNLKYFENDVYGKKIADLSFIAFGEKIKDDAADGDHPKHVVAGLVLGKAIKKAVADEPQIQKVLSEGFAKVDELQKQGADLETLLSCYGDTNEALFSAFCPSGAEGYKKLLRALSIWTYFVDVVCDYDDDFKKKAYNPLKDEACPTIKEYFDKHYAFIMQKSKQLGEDLLSALNAVYTEDTEWCVLLKILSNAIDRVIPTILEGGDVKFHLLRELYLNNMEKIKHDRFLRRQEKR